MPDVSLTPHVMLDMTLHLDKNKITLDGKIHFGNVVEILNKGNQIMDTLPALEIDLKMLADSDSSGLALLCAWFRKSQADKKSLVFKEVPAFIQDIARVYGLDTVLDLAWEN